MKHFLIVGDGISGCTLAMMLRQSGYKVTLAGNGMPGSSAAAAGLINPIVVKRFNPVWRARETYNFADSFYRSLKYSQGVYSSIEILRIINSENEFSTWQQKSDGSDLSEFLSKVSVNSTNGISAPFGLGPLRYGARLRTMEFIESVKSSFRESDNYLQHNFTGNCISSVTTDYSAIVHAGGSSALMNPLFDWLPIQGNKGQSLIIRITDVKFPSVFKGPVFLMPYVDDLYWVAATYDREFDNAEPTAEGRAILEKRLQQFLNVPYEVVDHLAGIRPTVPDRRPLIGKHPNHDNIYCFNGMGSRAALMAPWCAKQLIDHITKHDQLPQEIDVSRYSHLLSQAR